MRGGSSYNLRFGNSLIILQVFDCATMLPHGKKRLSFFFLVKSLQFDKNLFNINKMKVRSKG